jgi:hypothetical protein
MLPDARPCPCGHPDARGDLCLPCLRVLVDFQRWLHSPAFDVDRGIWAALDRGDFARP